MSVWVLGVLSIIFFSSSVAGFQLSNQLRGAQSPYLTQHADDLIYWQEWNSNSLSLAQQQRKPILLSIGYYACHWCHVMQQESFQNKLVADWINQHYIPIKVDRDLEPGLDQAMLSFAKNLIGLAGWPLNIYLTPDAQPYDAHVFLDAPALLKRTQINKLSESFQINESITKAEHSKQLTPQLAPNSQIFIQSLFNQLDTSTGGFIGTRKFPKAPQLLTIALYLNHNPDKEIQNWLNLTLSQMANLGLNDPVHGGFFRYTLDSNWLIPHFEKMLVDNAQLWFLYATLAQTEDSAEWKIIADQTFAFMLNHLYDQKTGAFSSSLSALDIVHREGGHYLWSQAQLSQLLNSKQLSVIELDWQLAYPPTFDLGYLPIRGKETRVNDNRQDIFQILKKARPDTPLADQKRLVSYNGLMLSFISQQLRHQPHLKPIAQKLTYFLIDLWQNGKLSQGIYANRTMAEADFSGYAYATKGLMDYAIATGDLSASEIALKLLNRSHELFVNQDGFIAQSPVAQFSLPRQHSFSDTELIAPSSVWIDAALQSRKVKWVKLAQDLLRQANSNMQKNPLEQASLWMILWKWHYFLTPSSAWQEHPNQAN